MHTNKSPRAHEVLLLLLLLTVSTLNAAESDATPSSSDPVAAATEPRKLVKRAPTSSFIGMRGKKELDASASDTWQQQLDPLSLDYGEDNYNENGRRLKKAPLSFVGVRGKKYNRLSDLLQTMEEQRLRESLLQDFLERLAADNGDVVKRAPTGFTGMRGKRPSISDAQGDEAMELLAAEELEKRAPVNAFVGVRGKKDVSHQQYKRAAFSEAYNVRGKKQRFVDFNKFVAVRGKKSGESGEDVSYLVQPAYPWAYLLSEQEKRAPNGFVGMRGKRPALAE